MGAQLVVDHKMGRNTYSQWFCWTISVVFMVDNVAIRCLKLVGMVKEQGRNFGTYASMLAQKSRTFPSVSGSITERIGIFRNEIQASRR